ncbi:Replication factor C large subunit [uncultured archaeon]|nr:Replication factor C large subunit [uncultured archaeon]
MPIDLAANSETSDKMKSIKKVTTTVKMRPIPPRLMRFYLEEILRREGASLKIGSLIKLVLDSRGDIRSMLNSAQAMVWGFEPQTDRSYETTDIEATVNAFFKAKSFDEAITILYSLRINPQEKINAFYSSIITSPISKEDRQEMLDIISEADLLYGKIVRNQEWRLLRYLDSILLRLYKEGTPVRYSQYNLSWPLLNRIRWDGRALKELSLFFAKKMHVSRSTFSTFYLPYILLCMKNKTLVLDLSESQNDILQKEMTLIK